MSNDSEEIAKPSAKRFSKKQKGPKKIGFLNRKRKQTEKNSSKALENNTNNRRSVEKSNFNYIYHPQNLNNKQNKNKINQNQQIENSSLAKTKALKPKSKKSLQVFQEFKKHENYKAFPKFAKIKRKIFLNAYDKQSKMAAETRSIFNEYFISFAANATAYQQLFKLLSHFEKTFSEYESKKFQHETKNFLEIKKKMNKLQKILSKSSESVFKINNDKNTVARLDNRAKEQKRRISSKFKLELLNNIRGLNHAQIKGMVCLVLESAEAPSAASFELDINKLSDAKVKELDKYVRSCLLEVKRREFPKQFDKEGYFLLGGNLNYDNAADAYDDGNKFNKFENRNGFYCSEDKCNFENKGFDKCEKNDNNSLNEANCFLGRKQKARFNNNNNNNCNYKLSSSNCLMQTSCTNPETPISNFNKLSKLGERKNSLMLDLESESEESSDEDSYSDLQIGNFKI